MTKTVLHILNTGSYSGAENVVITIIEAFKKYGYDTDFVYVSLDGSIRDVLQEHNIKFEPISGMCVSEIKRVIKKYSPDILHAHDFTASIICSVASGKTPVISHIHNNSPWIKTYCINSFIYGLSCLKYKHILGVSASVFDEYVFGKCIQKKTEVVGNPIDISKIQRLAKKAENIEAFDVVFLGRLTEQKDPLRFIDIIAKTRETLPQISAVMVGDGEMREKVLQKIKDLDLSNNITLKGFISNPYGILNNSKMLCIPSRWEGFGLVAVEALALGKPVLASPVGGLPGIVTDKCGALLSSNAEFTDKIVKLCNNEEYYIAKSEQSLCRASELDNIEKYITAISKMYE